MSDTATDTNKPGRDYYRDEYHFQQGVWPNNIFIYGYVSTFSPNTLFEFGCNVGRHLHEFSQQGIAVSGIDVSERAIDEGRKIYGLTDIRVGDDNTLAEITDKYDVVYVNSVLCHIENIDEIVRHLKRIGKTVIIFEAPEKMASGDAGMAAHWYPRSYEEYGFKKVWSYYAASCDAQYCLYQYKKKVL